MVHKNKNNPTGRIPSGSPSGDTRGYLVSGEWLKSVETTLNKLTGTDSDDTDKSKSLFGLVRPFCVDSSPDDDGSCTGQQLVNGEPTGESYDLYNPTKIEVKEGDNCYAVYRGKWEITSNKAPASGNCKLHNPSRAITYYPGQVVYVDTALHVNPASGRELETIIKGDLTFKPQSNNNQLTHVGYVQVTEKINRNSTGRAYMPGGIIGTDFRYDTSFLNTLGTSDPTDTAAGRWSADKIYNLFVDHFGWCHDPSPWPYLRAANDKFLRLNQTESDHYFDRFLKYLDLWDNYFRVVAAIPSNPDNPLSVPRYVFATSGNTTKLASTILLYLLVQLRTRIETIEESL